MKKSYNPISDGNNEKNELTRRIYRSLSEVVRQLDDVRGRSKTISDLFLPCLATLRIKLHDLCYKLILTDPLGYGKKGEELLWKKGYHDVFTTAKRLKKNDNWSPQETCFVHGLLISGMGHYQHLLFKLQSDYKVNIQGFVDFPLCISDLGLIKAKTSQLKSTDKNIEDWAKDSCHRCLIYLGDLNRYLLDIFPLWDSGTAERYYLQAANMNTNCGRPFNQLGTLSGMKNYHLDAVYYYVRCLIRAESFEGAEANVKKALDKNYDFILLDPHLSNPASDIQRFISKFLLLFDICYFDRSMEYNIHDLNQELLQEFQLCLDEEGENSFQLDINELELSNITPFGDRIQIYPSTLNSDMLLKIIVLSLICIEKLQKKDSKNTSVVIAACLEIFSQLLQKIITRFQKFYAEFGLIQRCVTETTKGETLKNDIQPKADKVDKNKKKNKLDGVVYDSSLNGYSPQAEKKSMKHFDKKKNKSNHLNNTNSTKEVSGVPVSEADNGKVKKKSKLKRRKRVRPDSLCESELSDSDITLNDTSSEEDYSTGESESDEAVSSDSEELDETLLIINQKIKEKKNKDGQNYCERNGIIKNVSVNNDSKQVHNGIPENNPINLDADGMKIVKYNLIDKNGLKVSNDKDKTKSLFTLLNGVEYHGKLNENSGGDYNLEEKSLSASLEVDSIGFSKLKLNESNEHGDFSVKEKTDLTVSEITTTKKLDPKDLIQFLSQQEALKAIKIMSDWLTSNTEALKVCVKNSKSMLSTIVTFLNLLKLGNEFLPKELKYRKTSDYNIPLSEDIATRGLSMLQGIQEQIDWNFHKTNILINREEVLLRSTKLIQFGHFLAEQEETGIKYNEDTLFYIVGQNGMTNSIDLINEKEINSSTSRKGQLMKNMGQLWLKAEVRDLECRVRKKAGNFSPYLVIDTEALIEHIVLVKQLVGSRQFIVIIPTVVLSHLDECKRDSGRARETIRWLESQFQHGNRSLRAQKSQERFSLPLIKYPKKKDKEAWNFFQIVECCHYFSKQSEFQSCHSNLLVTLLTGQRDLVLSGDNRKDDFGKEYSPIGVAKNFGINLEHIEVFHAKWKLSTKSHG